MAGSSFARLRAASQAQIFLEFFVLGWGFWRPKRSGPPKGCRAEELAGGVRGAWAAGAQHFSRRWGGVCSSGCQEPAPKTVHVDRENPNGYLVRALSS